MAAKANTFDRSYRELFNSFSEAGRFRKKMAEVFCAFLKSDEEMLRIPKVGTFIKKKQSARFVRDFNGVNGVNRKICGDFTYISFRSSINAKRALKESTLSQEKKREKGEKG